MTQVLKVCFNIWLGKYLVSGFINRYIEAFPQSTWAELKTELANKLSDDMHLVYLDPSGKILGKTFSDMFNVY